MRYRGLVLDLDGTVYRMDDPIPGASEALSAVQADGVQVRYISNNPLHDGATIAGRLAEMGITVDPDTILSAATVTADYLATNHPDDAIYLAGSPELRSLLEARDLALTDDHADPDVVVVSVHREFDYETMMETAWALAAADTFYGTDPDMTIPVDQDLTVPGTGAIVNAIAGVAGREPDRVLGKPSEPVVAAVRSALAVPAEECLVVGDRLDTDLRLGRRAGMATALVLSGVTDREDLADSDLAPDHVLASIADLPDLLD